MKAKCSWNRGEQKRIQISTQQLALLLLCARLAWAVSAFKCWCYRTLLLLPSTKYLHSIAHLNAKLFSAAFHNDHKHGGAGRGAALGWDLPSREDGGPESLQTHPDLRRGRCRGCWREGGLWGDFDIKCPKSPESLLHWKKKKLSILSKLLKVY